MRILHIVGTVNPSAGGPIEGIIRQSEVWQRLGHSREIASLDPPDAPFLSSYPIATHALGIPGPLWRWLERKIPWLRYGYTPRLVPWLRNNAAQYDAIVVNGLWNYVALGALRGLRGGHTPYYVYPHGMLDPWFRKTYPIKHLAKRLLWLFSEGRLLKGARFVLFTTEEEMNLARGEFGGSAYNFLNVGYGTADVSGDTPTQIAAFHKICPTISGRPYLLYLSRIHPKKGCDLLIQAFAAHATANPELCLVIAGPDQSGQKEKLIAMAQRLGVADRLHWPGFLRGDQKYGAFKGAEAFVLRSHQENFGTVVVATMASGTPLLPSHKVNIWREVESSGGGLVCTDTVEDLTRMLGAFIALSAEKKLAMRRAARICFLRNFDVEAAAKTLLDIIADGLNTHSTAVKPAVGASVECE